MIVGKGDVGFVGGAVGKVGPGSIGQSHCFSFPHIVRDVKISQSSHWTQVS